MRFLWETRGTISPERRSEGVAFEPQLTGTRVGQDLRGEEASIINPGALDVMNRRPGLQESRRSSKSGLVHLFDCFWSVVLTVMGGGESRLPRLVKKTTADAVPK